MSTENETGFRVGKNEPEAYRLVRYRADDGAIELKLQGCYSWHEVSSYGVVCDWGSEWRDIPTVDLAETQP